MPELGISTNHCECTGCGEFFNSAYAFEKHQIWGKPDGQGNQAMRCLTPAQMVAKGWSRNEGGWWITSARPQLEQAALAI